MIEKLSKIAAQFRALEGRLSDPAVLSDRQEYARLSKEHAELVPLMETFEKYKGVLAEAASHKKLLETEKDADLREIAKSELPGLEREAGEIEEQLKAMLLPKDPNDSKNVILEIRAGTGGDEATLFAGDLFRMYQRYAENRGWKTEVLSAHESEVGGFKEIIVLVQGEAAYSRLKFEGGVHRVQRVPKTEAQGRIHTSAVTVAVLPEADEVDIQIDPKDLRIDVYRAGGHGGQGVNMTDSAVRITHLPTGLAVACQDERSQHKNKARGMKILQSRLLERAQAAQDAAITSERRRMVGSGDRSERIRTYNFPQERVTDHRIGLTLYQLTKVIDGDLDPVIDPLIAHHRAELLGAPPKDLAAGAE